jgi:hypothetical protein
VWRAVVPVPQPATAAAARPVAATAATAAARVNALIVPRLMLMLSLPNLRLANPMSAVLTMPEGYPVAAVPCAVLAGA